MATTAQMSAPEAPRPAAVETAYRAARERYAALGVDTEQALRRAEAVPIALHCWQADDIRGLERHAGGGSGGLLATGAHSGAARSGDEIRADLDQAIRLIPGPARVNLHAMYAETGQARVERDALEPRHFQAWIDWACERGYGLDMNPTCFAHPMVRAGATLSSPDKAVREFWVEHCRACRRIAAAMARATGGEVYYNLWIPDGRKEPPTDRWAPRERLRESLDALLRRRVAGVIDTLESKLFGLGLEAFTVGSHEFYLGYAVRHGRVGLCFDLGHFHPTESVADKISAVAPLVPALLVHVSRGVRWDSDHVPLLTADVQEVCDTVVRAGREARVGWSLDCFDASVNRVAAYVVGARAVRRGLLRACLEPADALRSLEAADRGAEALAWREHRLEAPFGAVWDYLCLRAERPAGLGWLGEVNRYEREVLARRG